MSTREQIAEMIADWHGRSVIEPDLRLAEQIIDHIQSHGVVPDHPFDDFGEAWEREHPDGDPIVAR